jgi:hypothetical protein
MVWYGLKSLQIDCNVLKPFILGALHADGATIIYKRKKLKILLSTAISNKLLS